MQTNDKNRALIAMSGGVDSSLAAKLMIDAGYECVGCTMKLYDNDVVGENNAHTCCTLDDVEDARRVAYDLSMKHYVFNFKDGFRENVIQRFIDAYEAGMTPNPCIDCNRFMKFNKLFERAEILGCEYIVTGHYAIVESDGERYYLKKALDDTKDQSYVLYSLTQEQLKHVKFPLGSLKKTEVRELAKSCDFVNASKPDSQDICFVPDGKYAEFIERETNKSYKEGNFIDVNGNVLGRHKGVIRYTIGQRKGLGLALNEPMYVKEINVKDNTVMLARDNELYSSELTANNINLISVDRIEEPMEVMAKVRYRHNPAEAVVTQISDDEIKVVFKEPQRAITKGQAVVLYDGDVVVGGGTIM